ncbi:MAG: hypothetical protein ACKO38_18380 [Planctomycetota bacterium]
MKVHCGYCGEEMMGAVNRCWRCGHRFAATPAADGQPPIRRDPIPGPLDRTPTPSVPHSTAVAHSIGSEAVSPTFTGTCETTRLGESLAVGPETSAPQPIPGWLRRLEAPQAERWGTPFHSGFEPTTSDRWRRRQNQAREWLRLVLGDPEAAASVAAKPNVVSAARNESAPKNRVSGRLSIRPPRTPLADAAGALALILACVSLLLLRYPLIAAALGAMALTLAAISQSIAPRLRTVALIVLIVATLAAIGWNLSRAGGSGTMGPAEKSSDVE